MLKSSYKVIALVGLGLMLAACGSASPDVPATSEPVIPQPEQPTAVVIQPTEAAAVPPTGGQAQAPLCPSSGSSCEGIDVQDTEANATDCVKKIPYQYILVPDGTTWEEIDSTGEFKCLDQNTFVDGKRVIACTGDELIAYQLRLSNAACGGASLVTGTGQCQDGFGFDQAQQCCSPIDTGAGGSTTITVNMGACPGPQSTTD